MSISDRIKIVQQRMSEITALCHRPTCSVELLGVSKGQSCLSIKEAFDAGLRNIGENYVQEALEKIQTLTALQINWHFIGAIQSNKAAIIAQHFSWVHGVSRNKIAQILNDKRRDDLPALNVCIQVNIDGSDTKSGVAPEHVAELATFISNLPRLKLRGLMAIPDPNSDEQKRYQTYSQVSSLLQALNHQLGLSMDTLSMGMSDDLSDAIRAGSTLVRVGRGIFGERN